MKSLNCPVSSAWLRSVPTRFRRSGGFSMMEMMSVICISMILGAIAFMSLKPAWQNARVNNAYNGTITIMKRTRELAIAKRKTYLLTFNPTGTPTGVGRIKVERIDAGSVGPSIEQMDLPADIQFQAITGIPNTTGAAPDQIGNGSVAIQFDYGVTGGIANQIYFYPDGSGRDANNNINNGVVYLARSGELYSSRAITVFGAAGRIRGWQLVKATGSTNPSWSQL